LVEEPASKFNLEGLHGPDRDTGHGRFAHRAGHGVAAACFSGHVHVHGGLGARATVIAPWPGNRWASSDNGAGTIASYNLRNELTSRDSGGPTLFRGALSEPGAVKINGQPAAMLAENVFESEVPLANGTNVVHVQARDASGNVATQDYQVNVAPQHEGYSYDLNGNLESKTVGSDTWQYTWNAENQLTRVTKNGAEVASFIYDPLGRRVRKIANGITVRYVYDGQDILREIRSDGTAYTYVHGPGIDEPLARIDGSGTPAYYHADGLGSIVKMTDQTGATLSNRVYDAWGNLELGADEPGYAFTAREWDPETELYYYRARYYDPKVGRFISEDPIGFQSGVNFYGYVGGDPAASWDPLGLIRYGLYGTVHHRAVFEQRAIAGAGRDKSFGFDSGLRMLAQLTRMKDITQVDIHSHAWAGGLVGDGSLDNGFYLDSISDRNLIEGAMFVSGLAYLIEQHRIDFERNAQINFFGCNTDRLALELSMALGQIGRSDIRVTGATAGVGSRGKGAYVGEGGRFNTYAGGKLVGHADYMPYR
jgi:RHS repeat-associated protein